MALEIIDERFGEYRKNLQEIILIILAKEYPLRIGEICHRLSKEFNVKISFQAVRKSLNGLVEKKILSMDEKAYFVNKNYVLETKRLVDQLLKNYFPGSREKKVITYNKDAVHSVYSFDNFLKVDQFCNEIISDWAYNLKEGDEKTFCFQSPHFWYVFVQSGVESRFLSEITSLGVEAYYICESSSLLDKWTKNFYDEHNIPYKASPCKSKTTIGVFGDTIVQYDYPDEILYRIEKFYTKAKDLKSVDLAGMAKLMKFQTNIEFIVIRNKVIAQKLKIEMMEKFNK